MLLIWQDLAREFDYINVYCTFSRHKLAIVALDGIMGMETRYQCGNEV